jgi:transposase
LGAWARRHATAQALPLRSRIVLRYPERGDDRGARRNWGVSRGMVSKWRSRFLWGRLNGLADEPRPGRLRMISDEQVEAVITTTLEQAPPGGDTHGSTRPTARSAGIYRSAVSRGFGLQPLIQTLEGVH